MRVKVNSEGVRDAGRHRWLRFSIGSSGRLSTCRTLGTTSKSSTQRTRR